MGVSNFTIQIRLIPVMLRIMDACGAVICVKKYAVNSVEHTKLKSVRLQAWNDDDDNDAPSLIPTEYWMQNMWALDGKHRFHWQWFMAAQSMGTNARTRGKYRKLMFSLLWNYVPYRVDSYDLWTRSKLAQKSLKTRTQIALSRTSQL